MGHMTHCSLTACKLLQLELHAHEQLDKAWRRLAKRDAKAAQADPAHVPAAKQPEAVFLPDMLEEFLQASLLLTCSHTIPRCLALTVADTMC
jgi:hypothetical protein